MLKLYLEKIEGSDPWALAFSEEEEEEEEKEEK